MLDEIRVLAEHLVVIYLVEPEAHVPDVLSANYQRRHIAFFLNCLAECDEFVVGRRFRKAVFVKIFLIVNDSVRVFACQRHRINASVEISRGLKQAYNILRQRFQLACTHIKRGISHLHNIRKLANAVLCLDKLAVSSAVARFNSNCDIRVCFVETVHDLVHGRLCALISVCKNKCQLCRLRHNRLCIYAHSCQHGCRNRSRAKHC